MISKEIEDLVRKFERNHSEYMSRRYIETQARQEFINPFFEALGWDIYNKQGFPEAYKEVLHEPSLKINGNTVSPDYAFKIEDNIKFLVEAKKPSKSLKSNPDAEYQLRAYARNTNLPIAILTNFEEFIVYDCYSPPKKVDGIDITILCYLRYTEYLNYWDWISSNFSKLAVQQGSLDNFLKMSKEGNNKTYLEEITKWKKEAKQYQRDRVLLYSPGF